MAGGGGANFAFPDQQSVALRSERIPHSAGRSASGRDNWCGRPSFWVERLASIRRSVHRAVIVVVFGYGHVAGAIDGRLDDRVMFGAGRSTLLLQSPS